MLVSLGFGAANAEPPCGTPPCGGSGSGSGSAPPDLGDLIMLYRDPSGVPYLTTDSCQQPIPSDPVSDTCPTSCIVDGTPTGVAVVSVEPATCAVTLGCETCTQEVDFGRTSVVRSPVSVLEQQLDDVVVNLSTADCTSLDPAGRLVTSTVAEDGTITSAAIDSPLQNLAIYWQLLQKGYLGAESATLALPDASYLNTAARGLGAASDKTGNVNVDMVTYLNQILGLTDLGTITVLDPKICIDVKEEVKGVVQLVQKCFLNYATYGYDRGANFLALPSPPYIPEGTPTAGVFEYLALVPGTSDPLYFQILQGPILNAVFPDGSGGFVGFTDSNIGGFAQAADDNRAVIDFMHSNPVPLGYATAVPCGATPGGDITYDVSISEVSGLQVPKQMVDGTEGREFTVAVANAGPDAATGTVTVTAVAANGGTIIGSPWTFTFTDLAASASASFVQPFSINLGERTTISWTATAVAPNDVLLTNNTVTATTNIKVRGGGGNGGQR